MGVNFSLVVSKRTAAAAGARGRPLFARALIVGTSPLADKLLAAINARSHCDYAIAGIVSERPLAEKSRHGHPVLGALDDLGRLVERVRPDVIVVALGQRRGSLPFGKLLECRIARGIRVEDAAEAYERVTGALAVETLPPSSIIFSPHFRPSRPCLISARVLGFLLSLVGLVVLAPVLLLIALAIKLDSPGPVLFVQSRVGSGGKPFKLFKFRTMLPADGSTSEWARDNRNRITAVGRWLRKYRLDEVPQFFNVLRGDMNLVGPRPHPVSNVEVLRLLARNLSDVTGAVIPYYTLRTLVRPGITGWAQIRYGYANDFEEELEKLRYDLYYIKHLTLWLDLRILAETIKVVLSGHGSDRIAHDRTGNPFKPRSPWGLLRKIDRGHRVSGTGGRHAV